MGENRDSSSSCYRPSQFMRLPRILNQCHPIPGFVYGQASFAEDEQAVLIPVRPRKRSAAICSGCHQPASGYDQSPTPRRFEFIGFWGYLVFLGGRLAALDFRLLLSLKLLFSDGTE